MNAKLYIGNLSPAVSEADLRSLFSQAGTVTEVTLALNPVTRQSRGFAFVTMATPELAADCRSPLFLGRAFDIADVVNVVATREVVFQILRKIPDF